MFGSSSATQTNCMIFQFPSGTFQTMVSSVMLPDRSIRSFVSAFMATAAIS